MVIVLLDCIKFPKKEGSREQDSVTVSAKLFLMFILIVSK